MKQNLPWVSCVLLANGRTEMVDRAIRSFADQTYPNRRLVIWNTGVEPVPASADLCMALVPNVAKEHFVGASIGRLRNAANRFALAHYVEFWTRPSMIAHWDSDDWSHPRRLEEQVAFLEYVGPSLQVAGYRDMLFWNTRAATEEAWMYRHPNPRYIVGSSMIYRREAWESRHFDETVKHEDHNWWAGVSSYALAGTSVPAGGEPRMICSIHGNNSSEGYIAERMVPPIWMRDRDWDAHCRKEMAL